MIRTETNPVQIGREKTAAVIQSIDTVLFQYVKDGGTIGQRAPRQDNNPGRPDLLRRAS